MVDISQLTAADIGRHVIYSPAWSQAPQKGIVSSWNREYVFVRYETISGYRTTPEATKPEYLEWAAGSAIEGAG